MFKLTPKVDLPAGLEHASSLKAQNIDIATVSQGERLGRSYARQRRSCRQAVGTQGSPGGDSLGTRNSEEAWNNDRRLASVNASPINAHDKARRFFHISD